MTTQWHDVSEYVIIYFKTYIDADKISGLTSIEYRHYKKTEKIEKQNVAMIDSLKIKHKNEKIAIHSFYDNWITQKDRGPQLMELHFIVKENLKKEQESK